MVKAINVLIIEDELISQKIISKSLMNWGFNVSGYASTTDEAIMLLDEVSFDIALVDIYLGDKPSGLALGKLIRQKYDKPFIFLTSVVDPQLINAAILANSSCYLTKPFTSESLFVSIKTALNQFSEMFESRASEKIESTNLFFFAKNGKHLKRIEWEDVVCLRSDRNYTKVITKNDELYMIRCSLNNAISHVIPFNIRHKFVQINRAEVIQIKYIEELVDNTVIIASKEFGVTDGYIKHLKAKLNIIL